MTASELDRPRAAARFSPRVARRLAAPAAAVHRADPGGADGAGARFQPVRAIDAAVPQIAPRQAAARSDLERPLASEFRDRSGLRRARTNATIARSLPAARAPPSGRVRPWACAAKPQTGARSPCRSA